ncbi:MAG: hypothetical protein V2J89_15160 [Halieaceae bacterium]|jgi:KDO2-lipid IV(A) lauroyltransferase|nr:hypothetical protein [Halieaceae bacterium]
MAEFILGNPLRKLARKHPRLQRTLWRLDYAMVWCLVRLFALLPVDFASNLGERAGRLIGPRLKRKTAIFRENFRTVFPDYSEQQLDALVVAAWGRAGRVLAEYPHLDKMLPDNGRVAIEVLEPVPAYTPGGPPCIVVTPHLSNWEIAGAAMFKLGMPNANLYSPPTNPYLDRMLHDNRSKLNCDLLNRDNGARLLLQALKRGRTAGMVMDRRIDEGQPVLFFGREKPSTLLPAKLALKTGHPMVPARVQRIQDARYRVTFYPPVSPRNPEAGENEQARDMIQQVHELFERWILERPEEWFCSKRLWEKPGRNRPADPLEEKNGIESYAA